MKARFFKSMAACFVMCLLGFTLNSSDVWITVSNHVVDSNTRDGIPNCELTSSGFQSQQEAIVTDFEGYTQTFSLRKGSTVTYSVEGYFPVQYTYNSSVQNKEILMDLNNESESY